MATEPLYCLVEIPKGSRNKYEWDERRQAIMLDRFLFSSVVYPTDYGFIPDTLGEDGDPLDAMVCVSEPTFPGCLIPVKPIALFKMRDDDKGVDDKGVDDKVRPRSTAARRDLPLLLHRQDPGRQGRHGRRMVPARAGDRSDRRGPASLGGAPASSRYAR